MINDPFELKLPHDATDMVEGIAGKDETIHRYSGAKGRPLVKCNTESRGHATPSGVSLEKIRVDSHLGFVPLWEKDSVLRWRFKDSAFQVFKDPENAKEYVRQLMVAALAAWDDAVPVTFSEQRDNVDFEVVMIAKPDCDANGCVLASAFFPDAGRHELNIYPTMLKQIKQEQVETLAHEFGHVFGLRHWFAEISESSWPSELFGNDSKFSIMNYGENSFMTENDRMDLKSLYAAVWSGKLPKINGTPVRLFRPFSSRLNS